MVGVVAEVRDCHANDRQLALDNMRRAVSADHGIALGAVALIRPHAIFKTSSGKVQRSECRTALLKGTLDIVQLWTSPSFEWTSPSFKHAYVDE
jgi:hypothetical protein